ncbi:MAG: AMP-binding protein [Syntrophorhabdales bacterium]
MGDKKTFCTIRTLVRRNAELRPDKIAFKEYETGRRCTFRELWDRSNRMGNALYGLGFTQGDRVAVLSQNSFEYGELYCAIPSGGFTFVPVNFRLALPEIIAVLNDSGTVALFVQDQYLPLAGAIKAAVPTIREWIYIGERDRTPAGWHHYEALAEAASALEVEAEIEEDHPCFFMYTSGTTGLPKGVVQTHLNHYHDARASCLHHDITDSDIGFTVCPMYHATAVTSFCGPLYVGTTGILFQRFDVVNLFEAAQEERLVAGMLATPMVRMILDAYDKIKHLDYSSMTKLWFAGAGIVPAVYKQFIDTFGNILHEHHGTTETTGTTTWLSKKAIGEELARGNENVLASCGRAGYDMEVQIVDDNDRVITVGTGEMRARGLGLGRGYWKKPEQTKKAFRNGWFYTGDICSIDEKGFIYVIDRKKDMIITGGENVYPVEIERVIDSHRDVRESSVIGIPHAVWGEAIAAVVVPEAGKNPTAEDIITFCKGKIAGYKVPKSVFFEPELPRNSIGKVMKPELRARYGKAPK